MLGSKNMTDTLAFRMPQLVALYCSKALGKKPLALRVMKRIKIMEDELVCCMCVCALCVYGGLLLFGGLFGLGPT